MAIRSSRQLSTLKTSYKFFSLYFMHPDIKNLADSLDLDLKFLKNSFEHSNRIVERFRTDLNNKFRESGKRNENDIDVVLHGSYARQEATKGSDFDNVIVIHGLPEPKLIREFQIEIEHIRDELHIKEPGGGGLFGEKIAVGGELYIRIGLEDDTNITTTRRILLLTESISLFNEQSHKTLIENIINRYCVDYDEEEFESIHSRIPRFLLNDLIRYWRTIAVDFAAKRWTSNESSQLRLAKLRISRKLMIAGSLASVFLTSKRLNSETSIRDYLINEFKKPALARLASTLELLDSSGKKALKEIFQSYDSFLKIKADIDERRHLEKKAFGIDNETSKKLDAIGEKIQDGLEVIFFSDPLFQESTRRYGLF